MEAKDRLLTQEQVVNVSGYGSYSFILPYLVKQAEISFKAGGEAKDKEWDAWRVKYIPNALAESHKAGIKEVVEWLNKSDWGRRKGFNWQAKLKEWGI